MLAAMVLPRPSLLLDIHGPLSDIHGPRSEKDLMLAAMVLPHSSLLLTRIGFVYECRIPLSFYEP